MNPCIHRPPVPSTQQHPVVPSYSKSLPSAPVLVTETHGLSHAKGFQLGNTGHRTMTRPDRNPTNPWQIAVGPPQTGTKTPASSTSQRCALTKITHGRDLKPSTSCKTTEKIPSTKVLNTSRTKLTMLCQVPPTYKTQICWWSCLHQCNNRRWDDSTNP